MRVIDGMHRVQAAIMRGQTRIRVEFFDGSADEAFIEAVQSNSAHGLPLSQADKSAAARRILGVYPQWSNAAIASVVGMSDKTIAALRQCSTSESPGLNTRIGHDGRVRPLDPAEGRMRASEFITENPDASLREIAKAAGIAVGTAKDVRERLRNGQEPVPQRLRKSGKDSGRDRRRTATTPGRMRLSPPPTTPVPREDLLAALRKDPSLRLTEAGRTVLRLLDAHAIDDNQWGRLVDSVPAHCTHVVVDVARRCIISWTLFADRLEKRGPL
jgi:hypothetical protein